MAKFNSFRAAWPAFSVGLTNAGWYAESVSAGCGHNPRRGLHAARHYVGAVEHPVGKDKLSWSLQRQLPCSMPSLGGNRSVRLLWKYPDTHTTKTFAAISFDSFS